MSRDFYTTMIMPYASIIIKICRAYTHTKEDYEDFYQEVCLQIWKSKDNFREASSWSTWIYRITLNVCLSLVKKKDRKKHNEQSYREGLKKERNENEVTYSEDTLEGLYLAIKKLSDVERAMILLYLEERPYKEIADIMGTNVNNVGVRINRIKIKLKKLLDGKVNRTNMEARL